MISTEELKAVFIESQTKVTATTNCSITVNVGKAPLIVVSNFFLAAFICTFLFIAVSMFVSDPANEQPVYSFIVASILSVPLFLINLFNSTRFITFFKNQKMVKVQTGKISEWFELNPNSLFVTGPIYVNGIYMEGVDLYLGKRPLHFFGRECRKIVNYGFRIVTFNPKKKEAKKMCEQLREYLGFEVITKDT